MSKLQNNYQNHGGRISESKIMHSTSKENQHFFCKPDTRNLLEQFKSSRHMLCAFWFVCGDVLLHDLDFTHSGARIRNQFDLG
jgi:hypothetical protein